MQSMIEWRSGRFLNISGFDPINASLSGIYTSDFNTLHEARKNAKNILEHNISEILNHFARSLLKGPSLSLIHISKNSAL